MLPGRLKVKNSWDNNLWHSPFKAKGEVGVRSTLPQPKSAAPEKQCANSRYKSNILISLKEDISFSTTALEKHLSN